MSNITFSVEDKIIKKARKIAIDKNTTLTAMLRNYLKSVVERESISKKTAINELNHTFENMSTNMGKRSWTRDELYER